MCNFGVFLPKNDKKNYLIFLHEEPFLDEGGPEKQPIYLYWPYILLDLPVVRMCTVHDQENQCDVAVEFEPNITHPDHNYYNIESVEIGFHDTYTLSWCPLYHCDGCDSTTVVVVLPPSQDLVQRELQVAVKYFNCSTPMFSKSYIVDQQPICMLYNYVAMTLIWHFGCCSVWP